MINEVFKDIPDYEGIYQISNLGRVKSLKFNKERILDTIENDGYKPIILRKNNISKKTRIHRLLMLTFKPEGYFDGAVINHINGIRNDNRLENLEWCTQKENMQHSINTGLSQCKGENHPFSKLKEQQIPVIRRLYKVLNNYYTISKLFGVSTDTIRKAVLKETWKHVN